MPNARTVRCPGILEGAGPRPGLGWAPPVVLTGSGASVHGALGTHGQASLIGMLCLSAVRVVAKSNLATTDAG